MRMNTDISFVILAPNEEVWIIKTLEIIPVSDFENKDFSVEIFVVDNKRTDNTPKFPKN